MNTKFDISKALDERSFIRRLRTEPRVRAMVDGWIAQASLEASERYRDARDAREAAHYAAETAVRLVMEFIISHDGELAAVTAERDQLRDQLLDTVKMEPGVLHIAMPNQEDAQ